MSFMLDFVDGGLAFNFWLGFVVVGFVGVFGFFLSAKIETIAIFCFGGLLLSILAIVANNSERIKRLEGVRK